MLPSYTKNIFYWYRTIISQNFSKFSTKLSQKRLATSNRPTNTNADHSMLIGCLRFEIIGVCKPQIKYII